MPTTDTVRDLTDSEQNGAVLGLATRLLAGEPVDDGRGPAVAAEAAAVAASRTRLAAASERGAVHLSVVWAMYGETGRIVPREQHEHGEDFVREKVRQLDWLTAGLPVTWSIVAVDDGCPDVPSSSEVMQEIVAAEGYPPAGHRGVTVLRLADVLADIASGGRGIGRAFDVLTSPAQSRKGGSILAGLAHAVRAETPPEARHVVAYTDADLSSNLAMSGTLAGPILETDGVAATLGQRYGMPGAVLVRADGISTEPRSTGGKPDKVIILFRHFVRALLIPDLAHVLDTQAGFKAFDAAALAPVLAEMSSFDATFDVELLIHLTQRYGAQALAVEPIVFTEDFAATNFPSVDPGAGHLAMVHQIVGLYDRFVAPVAPAVGAAADLLELLRGLDLPGYVRLIEGLRTEDESDSSLFDRRWSVPHLRELSS
ncbi:hypothetical protein ACIB24_10250 [Spongisporangium articulatum]|uniref:Uncharacterized protein n=1 Tax=Spongisporangium articulatum TaxID=3362603 RepID=A0ABW8AM43_9ACTN